MPLPTRRPTLSAVLRYALENHLPVLSIGNRGTLSTKRSATVGKQITELEEWERDVIFPLAQAKVEIDLDDGVKRNYPLFGAALKPIKGLEAADE